MVDSRRAAGKARGDTESAERSGGSSAAAPPPGAGPGGGGSSGDGSGSGPASRTRSVSSNSSSWGAIISVVCDSAASPPPAPTWPPSYTSAGQSRKGVKAVSDPSALRSDDTGPSKGPPLQFQSSPPATRFAALRSPFGHA